MAKRRSKTLLQQAKAYECENESEMMEVMISSWTNGNFSDFRDYYKTLRVTERRRFINYCYNNTDGFTFYRMIDMLIFG